MVRLTLLTLIAGLALPGVAHAGCVATPGDHPGRVATSVVTNAGVRCTTNNGTVYELRVYVQTDATGAWRIYGPAIRHQVFNGGRPIANYYQHVYTDLRSCSYFPLAGLRWRTKAVLENAVTNATSVVYSLPAAKTCHG